ncbi:SCAN domain-containing protein 3-like [Tachysurus ichikawai]
MAVIIWKCCSPFLVRWLSFTRILQWYGPLTSYFKYLNEKQPRFRRLVEAFSNPLTEVYLLFLQATYPVFSTLNLLLQRKGLKYSSCMNK